ncbi:MAG: YigZ family protein [Prevotellaceae bacterium]|jgi:uncharacterized YigZ family protein|nr:YigZ family protein [Prevotellaceae bacterium]
MTDDTYKTIAAPAKGVYKEKGSKFLAFAYPVVSEDGVHSLLLELKKQYYDARHHCYAYRLGPDGAAWRVNDDGEPSSSAGRPILRQLLSMDLTNVVVFVIRYFGGIKLGIPGLIFAYRAATADALATAEVIEKTDNNMFTIHFAYAVMNDVMKLIKDEEPDIIEQNFDLSCSITLSIRKTKSDMLTDKLRKIESLEIK